MKNNSRKQDLLQIAYRLFITKGYEETSVDEIVEQAGIAKGTYYHYFKSKAQMLEEVIHMMIDAMAEKAKLVLATSLSLEQKLIQVILSFKIQLDEKVIADNLDLPENMHMKEAIRKRICEVAVPILTEIIKEGVQSGIFACEDIAERVHMILLLSNALFDNTEFTSAQVQIFIDIVEHVVGAKHGSLLFIEDLIGE